MQKTSVLTKSSNLTVNNAGGVAYKLQDKLLLAKLVCTSFFGDTFYREGEAQLAEVKELCQKVNDSFVASAAVYARRKAGMKDTPVVLLAHLRQYNKPLYRATFNKAVTDGRILRGLVGTIKSGQFGSSNLVNADRKLIDQWLMERTPLQVWEDSIGNNPSMADVIKLAHPSSHGDLERDAVYKLIVKNEVSANLPKEIVDYLAFKEMRDSGDKSYKTLPKVGFMRLTALNLIDSDWEQLGLNMTWNQLRQNINSLEKHGVFNDQSVTDLLAAKVATEDSVKKSKLFPYQIYTSVKNINNGTMKNAMQKALDYSISSVPVMPRNTTVAIDVSGSMGCKVNGLNVNGGLSCAEVAGLMATSVLKVNSNARVITFDTEAKDYTDKLNPYDSIATNMSKINFNGGGTSCSASVKHVNDNNITCDLFIMVSDNESWADYNRGNSYRKTSTKAEWERLKIKNPKAKLIMIDLAAGSTSQMPPGRDVLYLGGFSDSLFSVIDNWLNNPNVDFVSEVENFSKTF